MHPSTEGIEGPVFYYLILAPPLRCINKCDGDDIVVLDWRQAEQRTQLNILQRMICK